MLNKTDEESIKKTEKLKIPLKLILKEMSIPEESSLIDSCKSIEKTYNFIHQLKI